MMRFVALPLIILGCLFVQGGYGSRCGSDRVPLVCACPGSTRSLPLPVPYPAPASGTAVSVQGRVQLTNSKLKPRAGKLDASGVVVWLASPDGVALHGASKQRKVI